MSCLCSPCLYARKSEFTLLQVNKRRSTHPLCKKVSTSPIQVGDRRCLCWELNAILQMSKWNSSIPMARKWPLFLHREQTTFCYQIVGWVGGEATQHASSGPQKQINQVNFMMLANICTMLRAFSCYVIPVTWMTDKKYIYYPWFLINCVLYI